MNIIRRTVVAALIIGSCHAGAYYGYGLGWTPYKAFLDTPNDNWRSELYPVFIQYPTENSEAFTVAGYVGYPEHLVTYTDCEEIFTRPPGRTDPVVATEQCKGFFASYQLDFGYDFASNMQNAVRKVSLGGLYFGGSMRFKRTSYTYAPYFIVGLRTQPWKTTSLSTENTSRSTLLGLELGIGKQVSVLKDYTGRMEFLYSYYTVGNDIDLNNDYTRTRVERFSAVYYTVHF